IAAHHITRVKGHVLIDISLFPEGERELGTGVVISPVAVNDNLVDVTVAPGAALGDPVTITLSPATSYVRFVNQATTSVADSQPEIRWASDSAAPDGSHTVTVAGRFPAGKPAWLFSYAVPQPSRFAEVVLVEALKARGVRVDVSPAGVRHDLKALASAYTPENLVAEHVSPPLTEEAKVTLKVSQNLHASMMPFILSGVLAHDGSAKAGFKLEHDLLERAGLDLSGASQGDGAGGAAPRVRRVREQRAGVGGARRHRADDRAGGGRDRGGGVRRRTVSPLRESCDPVSSTPRSLWRQAMRSLTCSFLQVLLLAAAPAFAYGQQPGE